MKPAQKILMSVLWVLMVLIMVSVIGASLWRKRAAASEVPVLKDAPAFSLIDQDNQPVTLASLAGKPFVADFIFTHCAGPCPMMTTKMASLQKELPSDVRFISFSVDPERDTPQVLKDYAQQCHAEESRWHFLTGSQDAIFAVAAGMMQAAAPATQEQPILHSERFVLVDADGKIRGSYHLKDEDAMASLKRDATALVEVGGR